MLETMMSGATSAWPQSRHSSTDMSLSDFADLGSINLPGHRMSLDDEVLHALQSYHSDDSMFEPAEKTNPERFWKTNTDTGVGVKDNVRGSAFPYHPTSQTSLAPLKSDESELIQLQSVNAARAVSTPDHGSEQFSRDQRILPKPTTAPTTSKKTSQPTEHLSVDEARRIRKRERNRLAAVKCRRRKMERERDLEMMVDNLRAEKDALSNGLSQLDRRLENIERALITLSQRAAQRAMMNAHASL